MKLRFFFYLSIFISSDLYSQINFESGYFILKNGNKIDCKIKNKAWKNNPKEFEFILSEDSKIESYGLNEVKEFGITGGEKFQNSLVMIDKSSDNIDDLNSERNPKFEEENLFLKIISEGNGNLYYYENGNLKRFFYNVDGSEIKQLVYKRYLKEHGIGYNTFFKQQLFNELKCTNSLLNEIESLEYEYKPLVDLFIKYNTCRNPQYSNKTIVTKKSSVNLSVRPGINFPSLSINNVVSSSRDIKFKSQPHFRLGIEAEFILPYNKNKWGVIIEPTFQYFSSKVSRDAIDVVGNILIAKSKYRSIELPVGLRHYWFLSKKSKIFMNILAIYDFSKGSSIEFSTIDGSKLTPLKINSKPNLAIGVGYKLNERFGLELRYFSPRSISNNYNYWISKYQNASIILAYSLF